MTNVILVHVDNNLSFECRGRDRGLCHGCKLRFQCLTDTNEITIPPTTIKKFKIKDLPSAIAYMFGEGIINYEIVEHTNLDYNGDKHKKQVMRVKE